MQSIEVPADVWMEIARYLEPLSLLRLEMTCNTLRDYLSDRNVWATALKAMIERNCLFPPSYPIDEMDLIQLKRAALGPCMSHKLMRRSKLTSFKSLSSFESREKPLPMSGNISCPPCIPISDGPKTAFLVPGGRYLLSTHDEIPNRLTLWDLGPSVQPLVVPTDICRANFQGERDTRPSGALDTSLDVRMMDQGRLRVAVAAGVMSTCIEIFDVCVDEIEPQFVRLGALRFRADASIPLGRFSRCLRMQFDVGSDNIDCLLLKIGPSPEGECIFVWNYKEQWYIPGRCKRNGTAREYILHGKTVLEITKDLRVLVWGMPHPLEAARRDVRLDELITISNSNPNSSSTAAPAWTLMQGFSYTPPVPAGKEELVSASHPSLPISNWHRGTELGFEIVATFTSLSNPESTGQPQDSLVYLYRYRLTLDPDTSDWTLDLITVVPNPSQLKTFLRSSPSTTALIPGRTPSASGILTVTQNGSSPRKPRALFLYSTAASDPGSGTVGTTKLVELGISHIYPGLIKMCASSGVLVLVGRDKPMFLAENRSDLTLYIANFLLQ